MSDEQKPVDQETGDDERVFSLGAWTPTMEALMDLIERNQLLGIVYLQRSELDPQGVALGRAGAGNYEQMIRDGLVLDSARDPGTRN